MKKSLKFTSIFLLVVCVLVSLVACGGYEVSIGIGDGNKENDRVSVNFTIAETIYDGYVLDTTFSAESEADLNDTFVFAITTDSQFSSTYYESVLCSVKGEELKDGKTFRVKIELNNLSDILKEENGKFSLVLHRDGAKGTDITKFSTSEYTYKKSGDKFTIEK